MIMSQRLESTSYVTVTLSLGVCDSGCQELT
jgi:hypothetical protein